MGTYERTAGTRAVVDAAVATEAAARAAADALHADAGLFKVASTVLGSAAATIDIASISQSYKTLVIEISLRSDANATSDVAALSLNNDSTAANYDRQMVNILATTNAATEQLGAAAARRLGTTAVGATGQADSFGKCRLVIQDYTAAEVKVVQADTWVWVGRTTGLVLMNKMLIGWASTAAINRIAVSPVTGTNWVTGSRMDVYGLKAGA